MTTQLGTTITRALAQGIDELKQLPDPQLDAQWLLLQILNEKEVSWLIAHGENQLTDNEFRSFSQLVTRRSKGEPLAYILGEWEFWGRKFYVTKDVLVPRPSTEGLVGQALGYLKQVMASRSGETIVVADIGTGSGCIAVTICLETGKWKIEKRVNVVATDISKKALVVAERNAKRHGVLDQIKFVQGDMLEPIANKQVDLIISNPPYVPTGELAAGVEDKELDCEKVGLKFEPSVALDGGKDGKRYVNVIKQSGIKAVIETVGGEIEGW